MVNYGPLWKTMERQHVTTYALIQKYNFSSRTISNLKHNRGITVDTLEKLCRVLNCTPNDILEFTENE